MDMGSHKLDKIQVYSVLGSLVREWIPEPGDRIIELDLSAQTPGVYFLHAFSQEQSQVQIIIIDK